jgi:transposase
VDVVRVEVSADGYRQLRRFAQRWVQPVWAIEGAAGLGAPLTRQLAADGIEVIDVPAKLAARVRLLSTGHGRKTDEADAVSVGIAALTATRLNTATVDAAIIAMRALVEHRDDLVKTRTQTINRLHVLLTHLTPAGAPRGLTADHAAEILRQIRPRESAVKTLRSLAVDLVAEVRHLDRRIAKAATDIAAAVDASGSTLTELSGIGTLNAAKIIARVGTIDRFRSADAFATYTGTAPIAASSGDVTRHRLSRAGDRQLNCCLHTMAIPRSPATPPDGTTTDESEPQARATEKHCAASNDAYPTSSTGNCSETPHERGAGPGGHSGAALTSSAASSNPAH